MRQCVRSAWEAECVGCRWMDAPPASTPNNTWLCLALPATRIRQLQACVSLCAVRLRCCAVSRSAARCAELEDEVARLGAQLRARQELDDAIVRARLPAPCCSRTTQQCSVVLGLARLGLARLGLAWLGLAWLGWARLKRDSLGDTGDDCGLAGCQDCRDAVGRAALLARGEAAAHRRVGRLSLEQCSAHSVSRPQCSRPKQSWLV